MKRRATRVHGQVERLSFAAEVFLQLCKRPPDERCFHTQRALRCIRAKQNARQYARFLRQGQDANGRFPGPCASHTRALPDTRRAHEPPHTLRSSEAGAANIAVQSTAISA